MDGQSPGGKTKATGVVAGPALGWVRLLVAEDDLDTLDVFARILMKLPAEVTAVASCAGARHAAAQTPQGFDVIVADARLPDGSGVETAVELKRSGRARGVVVVSGDAPPAAGRLPLGVDAWLVKPVPVVRLRETVTGLVGKPEG